MSLNHNNNDKEVFRNTENDNIDINTITTTRINHSTNNNHMLKGLKAIGRFGITYGIFILAIILPVAFFIWYMLNHVETIVTTNNQIVTPNRTTMDYTIAAIVIVSISTLLGNFFNPKVMKRLDTINTKIDTNSKANEDQHNEITVTLKDHGVMFNAMLTVKDVKSCLNKIIADALVYSSDKNLSEWISKEGKTFVTFCDDTITSGINNINCKSFKTDINVMITASNINTKEYLGIIFLKLIEKEHADRIIGFRNDILTIASDKLMNSKVDRFRAKSEIFLQEYLASTIISYGKYTK